MLWLVIQGGLYILQYKQNSTPENCLSWICISQNLFLTMSSAFFCFESLLKNYCYFCLWNSCFFPPTLKVVRITYTFVHVKISMPVLLDRYITKLMISIVFILNGLLIALISSTKYFNSAHEISLLDWISI